MNKKKLLALLMALVMALTLVPVTAFADFNEGLSWIDDNKSAIMSVDYSTATNQPLPQATISVLPEAEYPSYEGGEPFVGAKLKATPNDAVDIFWGRWETEIIMTNNFVIPAGALVPMGQYSAYDENWVSLGSMSEIPANTTIQVIGEALGSDFKDMFAAEVGKNVEDLLGIPYAAISRIVGEFNCGVKISNLEDITPGTTLTMQLRLYAPVDLDSATVAKFAEAGIDLIKDEAADRYYAVAPTVGGEQEVVFVLRPVAQVLQGNEVISEHATLADAIAAANAAEGAVAIKVLHDCDTGDFTNTNPLVLTKANAVLDLNGKTVTVNNNFSFVMQGNGIEVKNGFIVSGPNTGKTTNINSYVLVVNDCNGVKLTGLTTTGGVSIGGDQDTWGTVAGPKLANVHGGGKATNVTITNCDVTSGDFYALCSQMDSTATINGGRFTANTANGCTDSRVLHGYFTGTDGPEGSIFVTDGTFVGKINTTNAGWIVISGGVFSVKPDDSLVKAGYEAAQLNESNEYGGLESGYDGWYKIGKVKTTEPVKAETATEGYQATYTADKKITEVKDETDVLNLVNTITVNVKETQTDTVDGTAAATAPAALENIADVQDLVETVTSKTGSAETVNVTIQLAKGAGKEEKDTANNNKVTAVTYEVHPEAVITTSNNDTPTVVELTNDQITSTFSFKLYVPTDIAGEGQKVIVTHKHSNGTSSVSKVTVGSGNTITLNVDSFSEFEIKDANNAVLGFEGAALRRRVKTIDQVTVVNTSTDFRTTFTWQLPEDATVVTNKCYFQWSKDGSAWSQHIAMQNSNGNQASLVITNVPQSAYTMNIHTKLHLAYSLNDTEYSVELSDTNGRSVMTVANGLATKEGVHPKWSNYGKFLAGQYDVNSYTLVRDGENITGHYINGESNNVINDTTNS